MSGVALTTLRAEQFAFTTPYLDEHLAFVTLDHRRGEFATLAAIRDRPDLRLGVPNVPYYVDKLRTLAPQAAIVVLPSMENVTGFFRSGPGDLDALVLTAERGSAWSLLHRGFPYHYQLLNRSRFRWCTRSAATIRRS